MPVKLFFVADEPLRSFTRDERRKRVMATRDKWNGWQLEGGALTYEWPANYEVPGHECTSSAHVLNWIMQVSKKTWATDSCLAGFVRAMDDIVDPQATLCGGGRSKELSGRQLEDIFKRAEQNIDQEMLS